jgi:hypothetical protein
MVVFMDDKIIQHQKTWEKDKPDPEKKREPFVEKMG